MTKPKVWIDAAASALRERIAELEADNAALRQLLVESKDTISGLVDQQAMPDEWWRECYNKIDAALLAGKSK